jgi:vacuolar protein 8
VQEGALSGLILLLKSPIVNILQHSSATLRNLSVREGNDVKMAVEGAIPPLIALLSHPSTEVQLHACGAIRNLSVNDENKVKIARDVGLRPLIELLSSTIVEIQVCWRVPARVRPRPRLCARVRVRA